MGVIESVAEEAAPFRLTCWGVSEIVYPEMTNEESVNVTELDIGLVGVTVITAEPCCPATGCPWQCTPISEQPLGYFHRGLPGHPGFEDCLLTGK